MPNKCLEPCQGKIHTDRAYTSNSEVVLARLAIAQLTEMIHEFSEREMKEIAGCNRDTNQLNLQIQISDRELSLNTR